MKTGELIRKYRKKKQLTMKQLGEKIDVSEQAISQYERGLRNVNLETLIKIAEALEKAGYEVDRKVIFIKESVKEVGAYKAILKLHKEVSVEIPFEVVAE